MAQTRPTKPTVLVVEDDDSVAAVERIALEGDYEVFCAKTIAEAQATLNVLTIDVVLLDWRVGNECGKELLAALPKQNGFARPITIVCSGDTSGEEALQLGAQAILAKPFTMKELQNAVRNAIHGKG